MVHRAERECVCKCVCMCVCVHASAVCVCVCLPLAFCHCLLLTYQFLFLTQWENNAQKIEHLMIDDSQNERHINKKKVSSHLFFTGCHEKIKIIRKHPVGKKEVSFTRKEK